MCDLIHDCLRVWRQAPECPPLFERTFTNAEQAAREAHLDRFLQTVEGELRDVPKTRSQRNSARTRMTSGFVDFVKGGLGLCERHLDLLLKDGFSAVGAQLAQEARRFDPAVSSVDIFQASRNAWTACGLQELMGQRMQLTPAIFAYSMLYPYTDNYLDDPAISTEMKLAFSTRLRARLKGAAVAPRNEREAAIWGLLDITEEQYPRAEWPKVWASLQRIHDAQENGVRMLRIESPVSDDDVLQLSFEKGGASVLADAYLAAGSLSDEDAQIAFGWGVLLQLVDDLQDLQQDLREGHLTIFTEQVARRLQRSKVRAPLDELTARTIDFANQIMRQIDRAGSHHALLGAGDAKRQCLKEMIRMSSSMLLIWSAGASAEFYTQAYLHQLETHSPFRFAHLNEKRRKLARWTGPLSRLFEAFLEQEENQIASLVLATSLVARV